MLTKFIEKKRVKATCYWPALNEEETFDNITVKVISEECNDINFIIKRDIEIYFNNEKKTLTHIQYTGWPDFGVPNTTNDILQILSLIKEKKQDSPVVVHCSAGVGRTGTLIALYYAIEKLSQNPKKSIDIFDIVCSLRKKRMAMVQSIEQYEFIYTVINNTYNNYDILSKFNAQIKNNKINLRASCGSEIYTLCNSSSNLVNSI